MNTAAPFRNRTHAGKLLAPALAQRLAGPEAIVLALPRGGVPVAFALARELAPEVRVNALGRWGCPM